MDIMRARVRVGAGLLWAACWVCALSQTPGVEPGGDPLAPLHNGQLVVWVLQPGTSPLPNGSAAAAPATAQRPTYHETDVGGLGQTGGSFGTDAASYGVPSDSPTISAPPSGTGYHEQTLSSFGNSLSTIGQPGQPAVSPPSNLSPEARKQLQDLEQELGPAFPNLHVHYASVDPGALQGDLAAARGTNRYPDVLIAPVPGRWWPGIQREFTVATLQPASFYPDGVTQERLPGTRIAILAHAPHRQAAQALAIWMSEAGSGCDGCALQTASSNAQSAALAGANAVTRLLQGEPLGEQADPAMAPLAPGRGLASTGGALPADTPVRIDLMRASARGQLAAVALRVIASSSNVFAVSHSLVVLRRDSNGRWRVLHVSLNLPPLEQQRELETLMNSVAEATDREGLPKGIAQASPPDGDTRQPEPGLWWDNGGGAALQVVEWQTGSNGSWSDPRLYLATDTGSRLRTEIAARFASSAATYRWRVWSVGYRGEMKISPWRTFTVVR